MIFAKHILDKETVSKWKNCYKIIFKMTKQHKTKIKQNMWVDISTKLNRNDFSVQFSHWVVSNSLGPHGSAAHQASLSITNSQRLLKLMSIVSVMPSNHLIFCHLPLLLPSIFPASKCFQMSQFFTSGGQNTGVSASASVRSLNIQD